ncbi:MAG: Asp-tRNA(Asn)/Glu-tRNA(Gln) amidotransferase GatCAB subunit B, partial [Actinomycetota bacterium]|nr:Asp-tRNA(Asn)/Glu-tRNA(Gln) amidotransferase GatCAB subunit B [Actinomycetota bacterium]
DTVKLGAKPKTVSNWVMGELMRLLNEEGAPIEKSRVTPQALAEMLTLIDNGTISGKIAKTVFEEMYRTGKPAKKIVEEKGLVQISDTGALESAIDAVFAASPSEVERYRAGEEKLFGFFVGQVMKATKGKANPAAANEMLKKKLKG